MITKEQLVLVFDIGTQSTRAVLINKVGDIVAIVKKAEPLYMSNESRFAEKGIEDYWAGICDASQTMKRDYPELFDQVVAVSVTTIRNTLFFLDKDCKQTRDGIIWLDKREIECAKKMPLFNRILFKIAGMGEATRVIRRTSPINWVREKQPEIWEKTKWITVPTAYFNYKLTGNLVDSNASQAAKIPYNYKRKTWHKPTALNFPIFGCPIDKMCELVEPGTAIGSVTRKCSEETGIREGTMVIVSGGDKACETLGSGAAASNVAAVSLGTASSIEITTDKYIEPVPFMPPYSSVLKDKYNPEVQVFRGYWMISWFKEQFAIEETMLAKKDGRKVEEVLDDMLDKVPAGSNGLVLQPFWGPGLTTPEAKGAMLGFSDIHTKEHLYRAIVEGINYALMDGLDHMEDKAKVKIDKIAISGGGGLSSKICQIAADMFGRETYRVQTPETSALGSAMVCFMTLGVFKDHEEAEKSMIHVRDVFKPNMEDHKKYMIIYKNVYKKMYRRLKPLYISMHDHNI